MSCGTAAWPTSPSSVSRRTDARPPTRATNGTASTPRNGGCDHTSPAIPAGGAGDYVERASAKDNTSRPQLQQLLHDAAAGKFDLVLVARIDRWSRNLADLLDTIAFLGEHGVAFHSVTERFHTTNPKGKMTL